MRIRWTPAAAADLDQIKDYLAERHPDLTQPTVVKLYAAILSLKRMPNRGRPGRERDTRELVLAPMPYIVAYRVRGDAVEILHIHHGARDRS
ncbi:MAG: type II toxin-antitoxin system RelE/ParE family toxin [Acidobacteriia bacterium]|nr:type II toxin-antitoxin system RelE/ParE family toxin [Terriglobia bacterium]